MEKFITKVENMSLKVANEKINQTQRNSLKADFMDSLVEMFAENGIELSKTINGLVLKVEGLEHDLHFEIDAVVKGLDYDLVSSVDEYNAKIVDRNEKAIQLAKAKEKRLAEKKTKK